MKEVLEIINKELSSFINEYYYLYNTSPKVAYPYVTGEYTDTGYRYEDGASMGDMLLEVWCRDGITPIIDVVEKIKEHFKDFRIVTGDVAIHISYSSAVPVRTNDEGLNKYEAHLDVSYWKGEK